MGPPRFHFSKLLKRKRPGGWPRRSSRGTCPTMRESSGKFPHLSSVALSPTQAAFALRPSADSHRRRARASHPQVSARRLVVANASSLSDGRFHRRGVLDPVVPAPASERQHRPPFPQVLDYSVRDPWERVFAHAACAIPISAPRIIAVPSSICCRYMRTFGSFTLGPQMFAISSRAVSNRSTLRRPLPQ